MQLNQSDLDYFVPYVLLDEASRPSAGKRQEQQMRGFWLGGQIARNLHGSDGTLRRNLCIELLHTIRRESISDASVLVASILAESWQNDVASIRTGFYERPVPPNAQKIFEGGFLSWRQWALESPQASIEFTLERYSSRFPAHWAKQMAELIEKLRNDPLQLERHREWRLWVADRVEERLVTNRWDPISNWQELATDFWSLGRIRSEFGRLQDAKCLFERALAIWISQGDALPHRKTLAVPELEREISKIVQNPMHN